MATPPQHAHHRLPRLALALLAALLLLTVLAAITARLWLRAAVRDSIPKTSGSLHTPGLTDPVTIDRNPQGVPSLHAQSLPDLFFAQGFTTAQDRLFQMDTLRRHAAGTLAEIIGPSLIPHDRAQRILGLAATADQVLAQLPPDQRLAFQRYSDGVNALIAASPHLPVEFRILRYTPAPWTPRDCTLVSLILFQDLTDSFPTKLAREALTARLDPSASPELRAQLLADLYPVGSWRDHPPAQPTPDVTTPLDAIPDIPLDPSQVRLRPPTKGGVLSTADARRRQNQAVLSTEVGAPRQRSGETRVSLPANAKSNIISTTGEAKRSRSGETPVLALAGARDKLTIPTTSLTDLLALQSLLTPNPNLRPGSNNWAVAGAHTASGLPLFSNDMHLSLTAPGIWYTVDLTAPGLHVAGVSLPGVPFVIAGHNEHVAWGFTNLGADVQDLFLEHLRNADSEFLSPTGQWLPVRHRTELIRVRGRRDLTLDVRSTVHSGPLGPVLTPIISPLVPSETRPIALRWTLYDTAAASFPFLHAATATSGAELAQDFSTYTGPSQNLVWADDGNHIGYHAIGRIPVRNSLAQPGSLSPIPLDPAAPDAALHQWAAFIPFDQLPSTTDPAGGLIVTANSRIAPDGYPFPLTLNWSSPYRTERILRLLSGRSRLQPADMLRVQTDLYSESDKLIAHRLAYAIDHTPDDRIRNLAGDPAQLHEAADLLRDWDGNLRPDIPAPLINAAARHALWSLLLATKLAPSPAPSGDPHSAMPPSGNPAVSTDLYQWLEQDFAQEQIIAHQPARWLPPGISSWDDLFAAAVVQGLANLHAPRHLANLRFGRTDPATGNPAQSNFELPLFAQSAILRHLLGLHTGSGLLTLPGNGRTVWQSGRNFGPSERLTADLAHPDRSTLVLPMGESEDPASPFFSDQLPAWLHASTFPLPFAPTPGIPSPGTLTLRP